MKIESLTNSKVKNWVKLHKKKSRDEYQQYIVEEEHLIIEALKFNVVDTIIYIDENPFDFDNCIQVNQEVMKKISTNVSLVRYLAICNIKENLIKNYNRLLILDNVQDPGNLGTIIRSARSFGFDGIYISDKTVDVYNDKCIRSSQGAFIDYPIIRTDILELISKLKEKNVKIVGTSLQKSIPLKELKTYEYMAFIMGNEGSGVSNNVLNKSDVVVKIEMQNFESLNVGVATSIIMYEFRRI
jgi:TrmH family RNA methyltransferase